MMNDWTDGYLSDVAYITQFYRQTTPAWLSLATMVSGHRPPRLDRPFTWCDLGCGQGFTALSVAACHPDAQIYGFDFNPSHTDNARTMAARAGLANATFADTSFEQLADLPRDALPPMDFIVLHGVWTWVSSTQRAHILRFIRDRLAPGGIVYLSYNALTGWAAMQPVQRLMRLFSEIRKGSGDEVARGAMAFINELAKSEALYFGQNPAVAQRLEAISNHDSHYLAHEFLHANWDLMSFDAVARDMDETKSGYIGSATLLENFDTLSVLPDIAALIAQTNDIRLKEVLRDFATAKMFRRDLFRRGTDKPLQGELGALLDELVLTDLGRRHEGPITINAGGTRPRTLNMGVYGPVLERLQAGPYPIADLRRGLGGNVPATCEVLAVLCASDFAHPATPAPANGEAAARARALNRAVSLHNRQGGNLTFQVAPNLGTALRTDVSDTIICEVMGERVPSDLDPVADHLGRALVARGLMPPAGTSAAEQQDRRAALRQAVDDFIAKRVPLFQQVGILGT